MKVKVIPAARPYKPKHGDLVCGFFNPESEKYLEIPKDKKLDRQVLPLALINPNTWDAVAMLGIDAECIKIPYECPYTNYNFYSIVPAALISMDLKGKWGDVISKVSRHSLEYTLDHKYHKEIWGEKIYELGEIGQLLLGSGYTDMTSIWDGSATKLSTTVNLDNGDKLFVYFWEWYNK